MDENKRDMRIKALENLTLSPIDPQDIMERIVPKDDENKMRRFMKWKVEEQIGVVNNEFDEPAGLIIKLNHKNYDDCIYVTSSFLNFFNAHFISKNFSVLRTFENIPQDEFFDRIDKELNRIIKFPYNLSLN